MNKIALTVLAVIVLTLTACACKTSDARTPSATTPSPAPATQNGDTEALRKGLNPFDTGPASVSQEYPITVDGDRSVAAYLDPKRTVKVDPDTVVLITEDRRAGRRTTAFRLMKPASHSTMARMRGPNGEDLGLIHVVDHGSNDDALALIRKNGLRPATARELLDFAEQHGELIDSYGSSLVALGTVWINEKNNEAYVTTVYRSDDGLHAARQNAAFGPGSRTLFLAAPK